MIRFRPGRAIDLATVPGGEGSAFSTGGAAVEARLRSLEITLSAINDFAYVFDLDGRFLYANRALLELWGLTLDQAVGKTFFDLPYPEGLAVKLQGQIQEVIATKRRLVDEAWYTNPRGVGGCYEYIFMPVLSASGVVEFVGGSTRDITDRKVAEDLLRESKERATHLLESITDGLMTAQKLAAESAAAAAANAKFRAFFDQGTDCAGVLAPDGAVIEANRHCVEACGFTEDEVIGKKFWDCGWWNRSPVLRDMIHAGVTQAAQGCLFRTETAYFTSEGSQRFVELTLAPITDEAGAVLFIAATGTDITAKRKFAEEREHLLEAERSARAEAERASRIKDDFLATLGHELRTPLNAILGWTYILKGAHDPAELAEGMETIERNARAQTKLIEDLLDMSSIMSGKVRLELAEINLASIVLAAMGTTKPAADEKNIVFEAVIDPEKVMVSGDANRLQQVFWNLLTNAIKFTPRGGRVKVVMERLDTRMEVSVSDTGEGISADFLPHVFDRFRQADASTTRRHGGLGLGLSIVKQLAELHDGWVGVRSPGKGQGATFFVSLPLGAPAKNESVGAPQLSDANPAISEARDGKESSSIRGLRILVVDDEADARAMIKRVLEGCEAPVTAVASAEEAFALLKSGDFDVLVSDIGMAGEDGCSLIRRVRTLAPAQGGAIPAIALTAYARIEDRENAIAAGFQRHLVKPVEPGELIAVIAGIAGGS